MKSVAIIGGGASGVMAAIRLKEINKKIKITIFEREARILNKVYRSGNGRANFGNIDIKESYYTNVDLVFNMKEYLKKNQLEDSNEFLENRGLLTYTDQEGRLYPLSNESKSLVAMLEYLLFFNHVLVLTNKNITEIEKIGNKYFVLDSLYDYVILATGSNAGLPVKTELQYELINNMGLETTNLEQGLVGFKLHNDLDGLFGLKAKASLEMSSYKSYGEVIFKEDGMSGICLMNLSNYYRPDIQEIIVNFMPDYDLEEILEIVNQKKKLDPNIRLYNLLIGSVSQKLLNYINKKYENLPVTQLSDEKILNYILEFMQFKLSIKEKYNIENSQVIIGGIDNLDFFKVPNWPNVYATGELNNNAGVCGGYNLWFAFTSGLIVADMVGKEIES